MEIAREKGLVSGRLSIVDSTDVKAKVDTFKIKDNPEASPDKEARRGYKREKKPSYSAPREVYLANAVLWVAESVTTDKRKYVCIGHHLTSVKCAI